MRVLHIGQRKTGTTWLQGGAKAAAQAGVLRYCHRSLQGREAERITTRRFDADDCRRIAEALPTEPGLPVFASLETLITLDQDLLAAAVAQVWPDARVLVTTRGPLGYLQSSFTNHALNGGSDSGPVFARRFRRHMARSHDLDGVAAAWGRALGPGRVTFVPFEVLRGAPGTYVAEVEALLGVALAPHMPTEARRPSPPPEHLALLRELNDALVKEAPEFARSRAWGRFVKVTTIAMALAPRAALAEADGGTDARPAPPPDLPVLPKGALADLAARMTVLRDLPLYQPYLALYGLAPAHPPADTPAGSPATA